MIKDSNTKSDKITHLSFSDEDMQKCLNEINLINIHFDNVNKIKIIKIN